MHNLLIWVLITIALTLFFKLFVKLSLLNFVFVQYIQLKNKTNENVPGKGIHCHLNQNHFEILKITLFISIEYTSGFDKACTEFID